MNKKDILFFAIVILCLIAVVILILYMKAEAGQCLKNPFIYGASHMGNVTCECYQEWGNCPARFQFNDKIANFSISTVCGGLK